MEHTEFPFTIEDIALRLLNLRLCHRNLVSFDVDCPFCGKKGKMNLNVEKDVYRCNYCGEKGGMLKLFADFNGGISLTEAYQEICKLLLNGPSLQSGCNSSAASFNRVPMMPQCKLASIEERHNTYTFLLSLLTLNPTHKNNLLRRGLKEEQIQQFGYKSTPVSGFTQLAKKVIEQGYTVEGVPGFYINENCEWTLNFHAKCSGFLVPILDIDGQIQAMQIRLDSPFDRRKYIWLSSRERALGVGSGSPVHFVGNSHAKVVTFTEGGLKGTIAHCITGDAFICNAGASQTNSIVEMFPVLKQNGVEEIQAGYDMDLEYNEAVKCSCVKILTAAKEYGFRVRRRQWNPINKGIDDNAWAKRLKSLIVQKIEQEWPDKIDNTLKLKLLENFRCHQFCSNTLVFLYFDKTVSYLAEKFHVMQHYPFEKLLKAIEEDRKRLQISKGYK
jgi:hypothetical protein